jgi:hypothetical protein
MAQRGPWRRPNAVFLLYPRAPPGGVEPPFVLLCAELDPYTKRGGVAHPV